MSAAACTMFIGCSEIITLIGASTEVIVSCDDDPMCRHTTVPSSRHACQNGSQCVAVEAGPAELLGVLREGDGAAALLRHAADLVGHELRDPRSAGATAG